MSNQQYFQHYRNKGFHFSNKLLTKYCLSLYTKPFVILSGISGTGKTKIAQLFETFVDEELQQESVPTVEENFDYIIMNLTGGALHGDGRANLKFHSLNDLFEAEEITAIQGKIEELKRQNNGGNITEPEIFTIETEWGEFKAALYLQRADSPLLRVRLISRRGDAEQYNSLDFLNEHFQVGDVLKLVKTGRRKLRVAVINNEEVRAMNQELDRRETELVENKLFVSVKGNWTDNTELFGFYNILEEKYNLTPVLQFFLTAKEYPTKPFFLILDEMNLSKVEHYFSDFLSCLESRMKDGNDLKQESIQLHNYGAFVNSNDEYFDVVPHKIEIPYNLYVTGTVNIDETTYAFSPKVLDRANVIEFNEVNLQIYENNQQEERFSLRIFPRFENALIATSEAYTSAPDEFKQCVSNLLDILQPYNLHFGYRVINEMALFVNNARTHISDDDDIIQDAIDIQIAQKVLPKLSGAFGKLDEPLRRLIHYMAENNDLKPEEINIDNIKQINIQDAKYPESISKLQRMYITLISNGFASFLE